MSVECPEFVTTSAFLKRVAVCRDCPSRIVDDLGPTCAECGCSILGRASIFDVTCPSSKWPTLSDADNAGDSFEHLRRDRVIDAC